MKLPLDIISAKIIRQYELQDLTQQGFIYMEIQKSAHVLPQAVNIAKGRLKKHLYKLVHELVIITSGLWRHQTRHIKILLVVDDFGIKYERKSDIAHLLYALKTN